MVPKVHAGDHPQETIDLLRSNTQENSVERLVTTGKIDGKKSRGKPRIAFVNSLRKWTELDVTNTDFIRMAEDRQQWRVMVANVCNRQSI